MIHQLITIFNEAFERLGVEADAKVVEDLSVIVYKAMTLQARNYHTLEHVFGFVDSEDPLRTLAALYHDIVYHQVDRGFLPEIHQIIQSLIVERDGQIYIAGQTPTDDRTLRTTLRVFGLRAGQVLGTNAGLNEFLSAMVMNRQLEPILTEEDLFKMTVCVEASIPFRGVNYFYQLEEKLRKISQEYNLLQDEGDIEESLRRAVRFANHDVESFAEEDTGRFLADTWKLLPELNTALRWKELYTIREYRQALYQMEASLSNLPPERVFHSFRGVPPEQELHEKTERVRFNILTASEYLNIKLFTQAILEGLAEATGGDAPLALFMGDLPSGNSHPKRLEDFLPETADGDWVDRNSVLYRLLESGRTDAATFDLKASPLSLFLYKRLSPEEIHRLTRLAKEMFEGRLNPEQFLAQIDRPTLCSIARASAEMVITRRKELLRYAV
jgi:hypothetical protein